MVPQLYQQIGRLQVELEWMKKNTNLSVTERRARIEAGQDGLSVARQCQLLELPRSSFYYRTLEPDPFRLEILHALDRLYTRYPFYGVRRLRQALRQEGYAVNQNRVHRLMQAMGLQAIYPRRSLCRPAARRTGSIPICCVTGRSIGPITSGPVTSPICRCCMDSSTW